MGFLTHMPITTLPVAEGLVNDLGIETEQSPITRNIKRQGPWNTTNVKGVYVAGDTGTPISNIITVMAHGMIWSLIGVTAIVHELCDDDDEIALERKETVQGLF